MQAKFALCGDILSVFLEKDDYAAFRAPVNWKKENLLDYPTVIKQPMDLGSIEKKLNKGMYRTPSEFIYDMRLIYKNCMTYNREASYMYEVGRKFKEEFEEMVKEHKLFDFEFKLHQEKTPEKTAVISTILSQSPQTVVDAFYSFLRLYCPECIEPKDEQQCTVNLNLMDADTMDFLFEFLLSISE